MILENKITKKFGFTTQIEKELIEYTCSDGKVFTSENDEYKGYKKGIQLAEEHEKELKLDAEAKKELNLFEIAKYAKNDKMYNLDYMPEFCFYFHSEISESSLDRLNYNLIYHGGYGYEDKVSRELPEGWYIVQQEFHMDEGANGDYVTVDHFLFQKLEKYKDSLREKLNFYEQLPLEIK